ncbi:hypothetical protein CPC08DRAFT_720543, partial [Agrocybe pediades]
DVKGWVDHANVVLPKYTIKVATTIPRGADGQPLFPSFNQDDISLAVLWDYTLSDSEDLAAIPWDDIAEQPDVYYSSRKYPYGTLRSPEDMSRAEVVALAENLDHDCVENPFKFYSWEKIKCWLKRSKANIDSARPSSYGPAEVSKAVQNTSKDSNGNDGDKDHGHGNSNNNDNANGEEDDGNKENSDEADGNEDGNNADKNNADGNEDDDNRKGKHVKATTGRRTTKATTKSAARPKGKSNALRNQSANSDDVSAPRRSGRERHPPKRVLEGGELDIDAKKTKSVKIARESRKL